MSSTTTGVATLLCQHVANTITQGNGNDVIIDCLCGAEIVGTMGDQYESTTGALMALMAPHIAAVLAVKD